MKPPVQPPRSVPVLTEVVVLPKATPEAVVDDDYPPIPPDPAYAATAPAPLLDLPPAAPRTAPQAVVRPVPQAAPPPPAGVPAPSAPTTPVLDEARVVQRVMADLDKQLDLMFEQRLREALTPVLTRMTDSLVREMRGQLAQHLREMVAKAVSLELDRHQKR